MMQSFCEANNPYSLPGVISLSTGIGAKGRKVPFAERHNWKARIMRAGDCVDAFTIFPLNDREINTFNSINGTDADVVLGVLRVVSHRQPPNFREALLCARTNIG